MGRKEKKHKRYSRYSSSSESSDYDDHKYERSASRSPKRRHKKSKSSRRSNSRDRVRKRSRSRERIRRHSPSMEQNYQSKKRDRQRSWSKEHNRRCSRSKEHKRQHSKSKEHNRPRSRSKERDRRRSRSKERTEKIKEEEIKKMKEKMKREKELMKSLETPEEKRARRLAKKQAKERKRKEQSGWDEEYMGYTNADNPFGDDRLLDTFVWTKKLQTDGKHQLMPKEIQNLQKRKMIENKIELEKVKQRRLEREREREQRNEEHEMMQRDKEVEYFREWEKQEDTFHLKQARLRSKIRIDDGRAKPIDLLARYISAEDEELEVEMHEPYTYLNGLTINDLEDLLADITVYVELEDCKNTDYWRDITIVVEDELNKLKKIDPNTKDFLGDRRTGINTSVIDDVAGVFKGKTLSQLSILENSIQEKVKGGEGIDVGYWESLGQQLKAYMARMRLRETHQQQLLHRLYKLKQEQCIESAPLFPAVRQPESSKSPRPEETSSASPQPGTSASSPPVTTDGDQPASATPAEGTQNPEEIPLATDSEDDADDAEVTEHTKETDGDVEKESQNHQDYLSGRYSPSLLNPSSLEADVLIYDPADDIRRLEYARLQVLKTGLKSDSEIEFIKKAKEDMNDEEATFSVQVPIEHTMVWSDKYRPRKPRFFNRVHTGFEWNKYNQTHYDIDNPPPKVVQGYKFNIFYPDLINKTNTPEYTLTPIEDAPEFCVLCFKAGPPYEDIGFKIVSREWEYSHKRGFRCQFQNNIFQLWFHFKRYRYRR